MCTRTFTSISSSFRTPLLRAILTTALALAAPLAARAGVVAHWAFEVQGGDKGVYQDVSGNGHSATCADKTQVALKEPAPFGKGVLFNGLTGSYLTITPITGIQKSSFTVAAWVYLNWPGPNFILSDWESMQEGSFVFGTDPVGDRATTIFHLLAQPVPPSQNRPTILRYPAANAGAGAVATAVPLQEWHHLAWVWDRTPENSRTPLTVYLDGEQIAHPTRGRNGALPVADIAINSQKDHLMRIGSRQMNDVNFNGAIDELWVFNEALPAEKIKNLMEHNNVNGTGPLAAVGLKQDNIVALGPKTPTTPDNPKPAQPADAQPTPTTPTTPGNLTPANPTPVIAASPGGGGAAGGAAGAGGTGGAAGAGGAGDTGNAIAAAGGGGVGGGDVTRGNDTPDPAIASGPPRTVSASAAATRPPTSISDIRTVEAPHALTQDVGMVRSPPAYSAARLTGVGACLFASAGLWCFVIWGVLERARLKAAGRL